MSTRARDVSADSDILSYDVDSSRLIGSFRAYPGQGLSCSALDSEACQAE
jgi:hypothetical protein